MRWLGSSSLLNVKDRATGGGSRNCSRTVCRAVLSVRSRGNGKAFDLPAGERQALRLKNQIFETIAEGVYLIRARDGVIVYANSKFEMMFGYEEGELIGKHVSVVNAPEEKMSPRDTADEIMKALDETGEWRGEVKNIKKDGTTFWCLAVVSTFEHPEFGSVWISAHTDITERKQAEEALERSYSVLHGVVESPKEVVIFALDRQYRYIAFNNNHHRTMKRIWGVDIALGNSMLDYIRSPEDRKKAVTNFDRALVGESFTVTEAYGDSALERLWYEDIYNPITDENGNVIGLTLFLTDITNRKRIEEALRESEEKFRGVAERSSDIIMLTDDKGRTTYIAPSVEKILGYNPDEVIGKTPGDLVHPDDLGSVYELVRKNMEGNDNSELLVIRIRKKDGSYAIMELFGSPIIKDGIFSGMQVIGRDITERKKAEEELRHQAEVIDQAHDSIITTDLEGMVTSWNKGAERLYGYTQQESLGRNISFIYPDDEQDVLSYDVIAPLREKGSHEVEVRVRRKTGEIFYIHLSLSLLKDQTGTPVGMIGYSLDITARKQAEEALHESRQLLEAVINSITVRVFWKDKNLVYLGCNTPFALDAGFERPEDIIGKDDYAMGWRDQAELYRGDDRNVIETGKVKLLFEEPQTTPTGEKIHLLTSKVPLRDANDEIIGVLGTYLDITARKKMEEEERLTRERFETLVKVSEMRGVSETELSGYVMEAACRMTGSTLAFIGTMIPDESVMDIISWSKSTMQDCRVAASPIHFPIEKAGIWADAVRTRTPKIVNDYATPHPGKKGLPEGHVRITRFLSLPILDDGKVVIVAAVANKPSDYDEADVTRLTLLMQGVWGNLQRRRSEEALRESERKFREIFDNANDAIEIVELLDNGLPGRFLDLNDVACRMVLYTKEEMLQLSPLKIDTDYFSRPFDEIMRELHTSGRATFETEHRRKDGILVPVEINAHKITLLGKTVFLSIVRDITERKKAEAAILQSEQKFRDIFNNTTDAIHIHAIRDDGTPGRFTEVNDVTYRMLGYTKEEMLAKTPLDIATEYHNPPVEKILEAQRTTGTARFETEYRAKDGTIIPVEINTHVVTIQGTKVMLGVVRDITERKKVEALLKQFNEELEQKVKIRTEELNASLDEKVVLLREVHHRVKNNLQILISLLNLQSRTITDPKVIAALKGSTQRIRAMSMVHEKLYTGMDLAHIEFVSYLSSLANSQVSFYGLSPGRIKLEIKGRNIMLDINTAIPLGLVMNELVSNALKHAFPGDRKGTIKIEAREIEGRLEITLADDGVGVPEEFDATTSSTLGLRLVNILVEQLFGTIMLDRTGAGAVYHISIPVKEQ
ncbi:MAG: PAS domain S-box protein [Methanoregula sp.]|nr:MAG: PAS domain S-box protein [Methanoregula sp.]